MSLPTGKIRTVIGTLENIEYIGLRLIERLDALLAQGEIMAAEQSSEAQALQDALDKLNVEVQETADVDASVLNELQQVVSLLPTLQPTSPAQVNAVTAITERIHGLTVQLKGGEEAAAAATSAATPAPAAPPAAAAGSEASSAAPAPGAPPAGEPPVAAPPAAAGDQAPPAADAGAAPTEALYSFDPSVEGAQEDTGKFSPSGFRAADTKAPLFTFSGDVTQGLPAGYAPYAGLSEPVPAQ